jgi:hypothetical protein
MMPCYAGLDWTGLDEFDMLKICSVRATIYKHEKTWTL